MFAKTLAVFGVGNHQRRNRNDESNRNLLCTFYFKEPAKTLFTLPDGYSIPYGEFETRVGQYAACLRQLGVKKGDRLAAQVSKTPQAIALYLATLQLGAIYIPLNTDFKLDEIRFFVQDGEPTLFVCRDDQKAHYVAADLGDAATPPTATLTPPLTIVGENELYHCAKKSLADFSIEMVHDDDVASICYTSGTTGKPKGAMITHANLRTNAESLCKIWRFQRQDVLLHSLPVYHVHGLFVAINTVLQKGCSVVFLPKFDVDQVLRWLPRCTLMMGVPTYYTRLLQNENFCENLVKNVRVFISGSAPLLEQTWLEFRKRTGHEILERYGMTEGQMICSNPYDGPRRPGTVGLPLPNVQVRIRKGVLEYKGPNVFKGYWRQPDKTRADFADDGYLASGDLAKRDDHGYVSILGRCKDLIISGGLNVYPKEVEFEVDSLAGVIESAVVGVPHSDFGEAVVAVVVGANNSRVDECDVLKALKNRMAGYKVPKKVVFVDALPRNKMGKVQKSILRDSYRHLFRET